MMIESASSTKSLSNSNIVLSAGDYRRLSALVQSHSTASRMSSLAERLAEELGRADVLPNNHPPEQVICMNCDVEFRDDDTGLLHKMTLVYPREADIQQGLLSVLTPVGTALIGLRVGDSTTWKNPTGQTRTLTVVSARPLQR